MFVSARTQPKEYWIRGQVYRDLFKVRSKDMEAASFRNSFV